MCFLQFYGNNKSKQRNLFLFYIYDSATVETAVGSQDEEKNALEQEKLEAQKLKTDEEKLKKDQE